MKDDQNWSNVLRPLAEQECSCLQIRALREKKTKRRKREDRAEEERTHCCQTRGGRNSPCAA